MPAFLQRLETQALPQPLRHPLRLGKVLAQDLVRCDLMKQASAMAYVTLLSLIPSLVAIFCVLSLFSPLMGDGSNLMVRVRAFILDNLASESGEAVERYLDSMLGNLSLSKIGLSSFASVLVTLILLLRQIELALNRIWLVTHGRNVLTRFIYFWTFLTLGMVVIGIGIGLTSGFHFTSILAGAAGETGSHPIVSGLVSFAGAMIFFFVLYKIVPNCFVATKSASIGALASSVLLQAAGRAYGLYVQDGKNYQTLYGALAQLPLFLTWLYICWIIILLGALISWRAQEGFPAPQEHSALDDERTPLDHLRNQQLKAALPAVALVALHQRFSAGVGRGLSSQDLAHSLKLPPSWLSETMQVLATLGYIVPINEAALPTGVTDHGDGSGVTVPYLPTQPAERVELAKLRQDLSRPMSDWLSGWQHELPMDVRAALDLLAPANASRFSTMASALTHLAAAAPKASWSVDKKASQDPPSNGRDK